MTTDIRDARFAVIDEADDKPGDAKPLEFERAFDKACALNENGRRIKVLYTKEASQMQITRFVSAGIPTALWEEA